MTLTDWDKEVLKSMKCPKCKSKSMEIIGNIMVTWFRCGFCDTVFYNDGWDLVEVRESARQNKQK